MRKAALQLLATLLLNNPFGPQLPADKFTVSLEEHKQRLKVRFIAGCNCHTLATWLCSFGSLRVALARLTFNKAVISPVFATAGARA